MKKLLFALLAACIPVFITTNAAYAQNTANPEILKPQKNITANEKALTSINNDTVGINSISPKALQDFTNTYKNVTGARWEKIKNGFATIFIINGVMNTIYYNTKGKWAGSVKQYSEEKMPKVFHKVGYENHSSFSQSFKQTFGITPKEFQMQQLNF